jgi:hypothetical protein
MNNISTKTKLTVNELDRMKDVLSYDVSTQLNRVLLGLTQVIHSSQDIAPVIRYNLNMAVENGNLLLALFEGVMDESVS